MEVSVARIQKGRRVEPEAPAVSIACSQPPSNPPLLYLGQKPKIQVSQSHTPSRGWKRGSFPPVPASGDPGDPGLAATALQSLPLSHGHLPSVYLSSSCLGHRSLNLGPT